MKQALQTGYAEPHRELAQTYGAIQSHIRQTAEKEGSIDFPYPAIASLASLAQEGQLSQERLIRGLLSLAGQRPPLIHILPRMSLEKGNFKFTPHLFAPTEREEGSQNAANAASAYRKCVSEALRMAREAALGKDYGEEYLQRLRRAGSRDPSSLEVKEITEGRFSQELRRLYLKKTILKAPDGNDLRNLQRINRNIYLHIYRPVILQGIRAKLLIAFHCADLRKNWSQAEEQIEQIYDIVHLAIPAYLHRRFLALLSLLKFNLPKFPAGIADHKVVAELEEAIEQFLSDRLASDRLAADRLALDRRSAGRERPGQYSDSNPIRGASLYYRCYRAAHSALEQIAKSSEKRSPLPPSLRPSLIQSLVEIIKLSEWQLKNRKAALLQREKSEIQKIYQILSKTENIYRLQRKHISSIEQAYLRLMLQNRIPGLLACSDPYLAPEKIPENFNSKAGRFSIFLLKRNRKSSARAIESAIQAFKKKRDPYLLHILENLLQLNRGGKADIKREVSPYYLEQLQKNLRKAYLSYLPFWQRWLLKLFRADISPVQQKEIYRSFLKRDQERALRILHQ